MKAKIFVYLLTIPVLFAVNGCKRNFDITAHNAITSLSQIQSTEIKTETISIKDSVFDGNASAKVSIAAEYPVTGNFFAVNSICEWISEELGGTFEENCVNQKRMFSFYSGNMIKEIQDDIMPDLQKDFEAYKDINITKTYETDKFVSFGYKEEGYYGGAHGYCLFMGQTFRKSDGRRINYDIFRSDKQVELADAIRTALMDQYFSSDDESGESQMLIDETNIFPLPETPPIFTESGILFIYQQYEIAAYAAGIPSCTISYEQLQPLMTQTGRALLTESALAKEGK